MIQKHRARNIRSKSVLACTEIDQQRIARLDRVIMPRMGMGPRRPVARSNDRGKRQIIGALVKQGLDQRLLNLLFGLAKLYAVQCPVQRPL